MPDPFDPQQQDGAHSERPHEPVACLPPWRVMLHDDEVHDVPEMIDALMRCTPLSQAAATRRVVQAQTGGLTVLLHTHRELAELYYVQLSKQNLIVSIEPVDA